MSAVTFAELRNELISFQTARTAQKKDGKAEALKLISEAGCLNIAELEDLADPDVYSKMIDKMHELSGKPPRLLPTYEAVLAFVQSQQDGKCSAEDRDRVYAAVAATELEPTEAEHLIKELKSKLPGSPSVGSIRKELETARRKTRARKHPLPKGAELVLFRCHEDDTVYGGVHDPASGAFVPTLELAPLRGATGIAQLCGLFGRASIDPQSLPLGTFEFRPGSTPQVARTVAGYEINTWLPPALRAEGKSSPAVPPHTKSLLLHVLGGDEGVYEHFLNWLAVAYQTNDCTGTAWIVSGCPGTGKGILFDEIITPLFGAGYCFGKLTKDLESEFNGWFAKCVMLNVDEAKTSGFQAPRVEAALRRYCTAPLISVNEKNIKARDYRNYCNVVITSNEERPISIPEGDRRYNVAPKQKVSLASLKIDTSELVKAIREEMPSFAGFLTSYKINTERARRPMMTEQRDILIENSTTTPENIARAINSGDLDYFLEEFWTNAEGADLLGRDHGMTAVRDVLLKWARAANLADANRLVSVVVPASHVAVVFNFLMPEKYERKPQEIGKALGLTKLGLRRVGCGPKESRGRAYRVTWYTKDSAEELKETIDALVHFGAATEAEFAELETMAADMLNETVKSDDAVASSPPEPIPAEPTQAEAPPAAKADPLVLRQLFIDQLDVDGDVAEILVRKGLATIDEVAAATKLSGIKEFDADIVKELTARAARVSAAQAVAS